MYVKSYTTDNNKMPFLLYMKTLYLQGSVT
jgi:hypothetical protein